MSPNPAQPQPRADPFPEQLGDFQLIERLGGGGMGVVYLARQQSLGRLVALKLVHPEHLYFPGMRERFLREVEASARLQHPGIVPIHTFGEEAGVPYFAMERIEGCTLAEALRTLPDRAQPGELAGADLRAAVVRATQGADGATPTPLAIPLYGGSYVETVLRIALQVAEALAHAHERGVLHRDVKPSNVMVTPGGRVLLLDFGLATTGEVSRLTKTGTLIGSLPYLPPENFSGEAPPSPAGDVYSLGVTLYELLALKLPFRDDSFELLREEKLRGTPPSLGAVNAAVAWDVETVCLKAMEREPPRRYATALAFAHDLENLLHLRPIRASRPGLALRTRRWCQRHPAWTVALVAGVALAAGAPLGFMVVQQRNLAALRIEQARTDAQKQRALENYRRVLDAVDRGVRRLDAPELDELPQIESLRRAAFEDALAVYQQFTGEEARFPELGLEIARARSRLATLLRLLGRAQEAEAAWRAALPTLTDQLRERPDDRLLAYDVASARAELAQVLLDRADPAEAEELLLAAIAGFDALVAADPDDPDFGRHVVDVRIRLAATLLRTGRTEEALAQSREAAALIDEKSARYADDDLRLHALQTLHQAAQIELEAGEDAAAQALLARAVAVLATPFPERLARLALQSAAAIESLRGMLAMNAGDEQAELAAKQAAVERMRELATRWPEVQSHRRDLAAALSNLGMTQQQVGDLDAARAGLLESLDLLAALIEREPELVEHNARLAATLTNFAVVELDRGEPDAALARLDEARAQVDLLAARNGSDPRIAACRLSNASYRAEAQIKRGDAAAAREAAREMLELAPEDPDNRHRVQSVLDLAAALERAR